MGALQLLFFFLREIYKVYYEKIKSSVVQAKAGLVSFTLSMVNDYELT